MKWCARCRRLKEDSGFKKNRSRLTGLSDWCKVCSYDYHQVYRRTEKYRNDRKAWLAKHPRSDKTRKADRKRAKEQRAKFPEKCKARDKLNKLKAKGFIVAPSRCSSCGHRPRYGRDGRKLLHGHHYKGYSNPLKVAWLCIDCHAKMRRQRGE